jgi:hypothetical protein
MKKYNFWKLKSLQTSKFYITTQFNSAFSPSGLFLFALLATIRETDEYKQESGSGSNNLEQ